MRSIPTWKVKREAKRLVWQISQIFPNLWEYMTLTFRYDSFRSKDQKHHIGDKKLTKEAAIYLIFPKNGVLKSHLQMLDELNRQSITPYVVSNYPVSDSDLASLKSKCALIIERPNVGYDFGGYRDAILKLAEKLPGLERLYILNDSVWMIDSKKSWFASVRETGRDFCGATSNYGIQRYSEDDFREIVWVYTPDHWNFHYASYALAVGKKILTDPSFIVYWKRFRLSNDKKRTVRRGEIGLSKWVKKRGYTHAATCDVHRLDRELEALQPEVIDEVTRNLIIPEHPRLVQKRDEVLKSDPQSNQGISDRVKFILTTVSLQAMGYSMPFYSLKYRDFQFIKKSPLWLSNDAASRTLSILEELDGPLGRQASLEAQQIVKSTFVRERSERDEK